MGREIGCKMRHVFDHTQKHNGARAHKQSSAGFDSDANRRITRYDQILHAPDRHDAGDVVINLLPDPIFVGTEMSGPINAT